MIAVTVLSARSGMLAGRKAYFSPCDDRSSAATYYAIYHMVSSLNQKSDGTSSLCRIQKLDSQLIFHVVRLDDNDDWLVISEMKSMLSLEATMDICQSIERGILKTPIVKPLNGKMQLDGLACTYMVTMMRLYDRMRARVPYFESRKVLLVLSCSQFKTLAVKSQLPQTKSSSEQDTVRMPEQAVYQSFGHEFHEQRVGCSQALYFMFGKYARKVLSPCCSRGSSEVVPLCLTSDHVTPDKALTAVKPRYICQYMEPRSGPSTDAGDDAGANNDIIDGVSSQLHATTIVRDIICGTSDFFVERAKKTCGGIERFLYNTETKSITGVSARTAQIGLNSSILGDGSAHEEEVCSSSAVITSEQPAGKYFCTAPSTGRMAGNSRSQQVQMSGGELSTKFTLISSEVCTAGPTVGCSAGSATVLAPSLLESPVPATVDSSELEVLYYAELDLILVCQEITHNVTTDTLDIKMGRGSFLELDVEAQDLLDYLIMAHSCLKHRLIESVRELPID